MSRIALNFYPSEPIKRVQTPTSVDISPVKNINPLFVTGFIDAEGCFSLALASSKRYKQGYLVNLIFTISLHYKDKDLLTQINNYFGVGYIAKHGASSY